MAHRNTTVTETGGAMEAMKVMGKKAAMKKGTKAAMKKGTKAMKDSKG